MVKMYYFPFFSVDSWVYFHELQFHTPPLLMILLNINLILGIVNPDNIGIFSKTLTSCTLHHFQLAKSSYCISLYPVKLYISQFHTKGKM